MHNAGLALRSGAGLTVRHGFALLLEHTAQRVTLADVEQQQQQQEGGDGEEEEEQRAFKRARVLSESSTLRRTRSYFARGAAEQLRNRVVLGGALRYSSLDAYGGSTAHFENTVFRRQRLLGLGDTPGQASVAGTSALVRRLGPVFASQRAKVEAECAKHPEWRLRLEGVVQVQHVSATPPSLESVWEEVQGRGEEGLREALAIQLDHANSFAAATPDSMHGLERLTPVPG